MGEARKEALKLGYDHSIWLEFHGAMINSDTGLLAYRDVDDTFTLMAIRICSTRSLSVRRERAKHVTGLPKPLQIRMNRQEILRNVKRSHCCG